MLFRSEATLVGRAAAGNEPDVPRFHGEDALSAWRPVIDAVKAEGSAFWPQLWHVGAIRNPGGKWTPPVPAESPSGLGKPGREYGVAMTEADCEATIKAFAQAAADARRLGCTGIEIHGAHGYLLDQFFWSGTNQRRDRWGGASLVERARFAAEVVRACRQARPRGFPCAPELARAPFRPPIGCKLSAQLQTRSALSSWNGRATLAELGRSLNPTVSFGL